MSKLLSRILKELIESSRLPNKVSHIHRFVTISENTNTIYENALKEAATKSKQLQFSWISGITTSSENKPVYSNILTNSNGQIVAAVASFDTNGKKSYALASELAPKDFSEQLKELPRELQDILSQPFPNYHSYVVDPKDLPNGNLEECMNFKAFEPKNPSNGKQ